MREFVKGLLDKHSTMCPEYIPLTDDFVEFTDKINGRQYTGQIRRLSTTCWKVGQYMWHVLPLGCVDDPKYYINVELEEITKIIRHADNIAKYVFTK